MTARSMPDERQSSRNVGIDRLEAPAREDERAGLRSAPAGWMHVILLVNRLALGWYLSMAGWDKAQGEWSEGLGAFYRSDVFTRRQPPWLPDMVAAPYAHALPWAEILLGALLMLGLFSRLVPGAIALLFASIWIGLLHAGDLLPSHHTMVFFAHAVLLFACGPGRYSLDARLFRSSGMVAP